MIYLYSYPLDCYLAFHVFPVVRHYLVTLPELTYLSYGRDLSSESGMVFEIADEPEENRHAQPQKPFYDDAALISSLSLDGGMYEDDESRGELLTSQQILFL